jgi:hypothetical protein
MTVTPQEKNKSRRGLFQRLGAAVNRWLARMAEAQKKAPVCRS